MPRKWQPRPSRSRCAPVDPDEAKHRAEERERTEKQKSDPRVVRRFAYRAETSYFDDRTAHVYVLEVDLETGLAEGQPRRLTQDQRNYGDPQWMPDGSALLATVDRLPGTDDLFYYPTSCASLLMVATPCS